MAAYQDLYIDTYSRGLVVGPATTRTADPPLFTQGDTLSLRIYLLARLTTYPDTPYEIVNNAALSLKVALGPKDGAAGSALYTQQFTWAADAQNQYFYADLPLNTAAIASLIGTAATADAWFEVKYVQNGVPNTVLQKKVTVNAEVIETTPLTAPAGETAATLSYSEATYLKAENTGFVLKNETTGQRMQVYLGDDGVLHTEILA